jgi:two-component system response regulator AtoC
MESSSYWEETASPDFLLSVNDRMLQIRQKLLEAGPTRLPIVLIGERGLGKEALAQAVHRWSNRAAGPFVRIHCSVIPMEQLSAELFGSRAGAPRSAAAGAADPAGNGSRARSQENDGDGSTAFARARGGTLYLSGIETFETNLCSRINATLARAEEEHRDEVPRLVLSSEAPEQDPALQRLIEQLFGKGSSLVVRVPPLRERPEDIGLLAQHLLQVHGPSYSSRIKQVRSSLIDLFKQYSWPGNVRELERVIRRFLVLEDESAIRRELEEKIWQGKGRRGADFEEIPSGLKLHEIGKLAAQRAEARAIRQVLEQTRWNKKAAALELGVSYKSLLNKVRDYRLDS